MQTSGLSLYTSTYRIHGLIDTGRRRLSDLLNDDRFDVLELAEASYLDLLDSSAPVTPAARVLIRKASVQLALPADGAHRLAAARVSTQRHPITLSLGLFRVTGDWHRRAGQPASCVHLLNGNSARFLPLTNARVCYLPDGQADLAAPVIIVNTRRTEFCAAEPTRTDADNRPSLDRQAPMLQPA
jgi:hypothetical protein